MAFRFPVSYGSAFTGSLKKLSHPSGAINFSYACIESLPISEAHANSFLEVIDNLIVEQKQKLQEIQNKEEEDRIKAEEKALAEKQEAEQAKKSEIDDVVEKMLSDGVSADDILAKLK